MSDASDAIDCPLCFCPFPANQIERHAAHCNGVPEGGTAGDNSAPSVAPNPHPAAFGADGSAAPPQPPLVAPATSGATAAASAQSRPAAAIPQAQPRPQPRPAPGGLTAAESLCPLCNVNFPIAHIEQHAAYCSGAPGVKADTTASGVCHAGCGRAGNPKYGGFCLPCLNKRGGTASLRPKTVLRQALSGRNVDVCQGDITLETAEAIVNPANSKLDHASGVAGAIRRAAGPEMLDDGDALLAGLAENRVPTGDAVITRAGGSLQCRWVIHAVGPTWKGGGHGEVGQLASCIRRALEIADSKRLISIAIPAVSSGIFGFPKDQCAHTIINAIFQFLNDHPNTPIRTVRMTNVDDATVAVFKTALGSEQRPTCSSVRWIAGAEDAKQVIRVMHGTPYAVQRCAVDPAAVAAAPSSVTAAAAGEPASVPPPATSLSLSSSSVVVVDFCNLGWELITPYIDADDMKLRLQQSLRNAVAAQGLSGAAETPASPVRTFAVRDPDTDTRVAIAAIASNKFDEASFARLIESAQSAIVHAAATGATTVAVPLLAASTLAFSSTHSARAVLEAARRVLARRGELGSPALSIALCEGTDTAFFVEAVRTTFTVPVIPGKTDPGAGVLATYVEPPALVFGSGLAASSSSAAATAASPVGTAAAGQPTAAASTAPPSVQPPADETPAQRRARQREEAEARLALRMAAENP